MFIKRKAKSAKHLLFGILTILTLAGCEGILNFSFPETFDVESVSLTGETSCAIGGTIQLTATVAPDEATNKSVSWSSDNTYAAVVDESGLVTAIAEGSATITVTTEDGEFRDSLDISVISSIVSVQSVSLSGTDSCVENDSVMLTATVYPANATNKTVLWESDNTDAAVVDESGLVTAVAEGSATITVTTEDGGFQDSLNFSVTSSSVSVQSVTLTGASSCPVNSSVRLTATVYPENASNKTVIWESDNTDAAVVDNSGLVTAIAEGYATITVTTEDGGFTATRQIEITAETAGGGSTVADHSIMRMLYDENIPQSAIEAAVSSLKIGYGHTSHGSQIITGMEGLVQFANDNMNSYDDNLFRWSTDGSAGLHLFDGSGYDDSGYLAYDVGYGGWDDRTRTFLNDNPWCNVIIWAWCGEVWYTDIQSHYIDNMEALEAEYPGVTFVYMTGHVDEPYEAEILAHNNIIRDYCRDNNKWLFDFADIEKYNLDLEYFGDRKVDDTAFYDSDGDGVLEQPAEDWMDPQPGNDANWALEWQAAHTEGVDWYNVEAVHSRALTANQKAYAIWWLFARIAGWDGE